MKRSRSIQLTLVASVAASLVSCNNRPTRYCVDDNQTVANDYDCERNTARHHWYYVPYAAGAYALGSRISGGSVTTPASGYRTGATVRGGIGGAGEAAAGHASGAAHGGAGE